MADKLVSLVRIRILAFRSCVYWIFLLGENNSICETAKGKL